MTKVKLEFISKRRLNCIFRTKLGIYHLVWSYILDYENGKNPYEEKRLAISPWRAIASSFIAEETEEILTFAESLVLRGIKTYDALHISWL